MRRTLSKQRALAALSCTGSCGAFFRWRIFLASRNGSLVTVGEFDVEKSALDHLGGSAQQFLIFVANEGEASGENLPVVKMAEDLPQRFDARPIGGDSQVESRPHPPGQGVKPLARCLRPRPFQCYPC